MDEGGDDIRFWNPVRGSISILCWGRNTWMMELQSFLIASISPAIYPAISGRGLGQG